jgi:Na+/H+-dicarboxylate symporters
MSIGENKLVIGIILGALLGIFCGWSFGESMLSLSWLGDLFLDALKMMIVPLIVGAIISGVTSLGDVRRLGKSWRLYSTLLCYDNGLGCFNWN